MSKTIKSIKGENKQLKKLVVENIGELNIKTKTDLFYNYIIDLIKNDFKVYAYDME